jgi:putative membrane protein
MVVLLNQDDHRRIAQAVGAAEATTRGEIVCVVTDEAARYAEVPLAWAAAGAILLPILALAVAALAGHSDYALGGWAAAHVAAAHAAVLTALASYALVQCVLFIGILLLVSFPPIRRALTPASLKRAHVRARALEHFFARGLDKTHERTGVLIFVSLKDRRAEILADTGISSKVAPVAWDEIIDELVNGAKADRAGDGFVAAIARCGRILSTHFPANSDNLNELPNGVVER